MANNSIFSAFERMWQHVTAALGTKADSSYVTSELAKKSDAGHTHTVSHAPAGTVSTPELTGTQVTTQVPDTTNVTSVNSMTGAGTLPSASLSAGTKPSCSYTAPSHTYTAPSHTYTAPSMTSKIADKGMTITFDAGAHSFSAGSHSFSAGSHSFSEGTYPTLTFSAGSLPTYSAVNVPSTKHTHTVTAAGTVSKPTFTGTAATLTTSAGK
jgi:hypothetical protein